ncbi:hypothetical protein NQ315_010054 [Exocentrus adspersus]|uniref:Tyrosine-protein kinase Wsck n=1 Tax=Exocentrus adspersus TaxID=1586481 RepID=A0AAV8WA80_9CUCU|nr:hypothetical protein NQ315_010054 [Exocentrus adspersus]
MLRALLLSVIICNAVCYQETLLGCYKDLPTLRTLTLPQLQPKDECLKTCYTRYYRYSYIYNTGQCICGNYLGEQVTNVTCSDCDSCDPQQNLMDIYATGNLVSKNIPTTSIKESCLAPPRNFTVTNITETSARLSWQEPESFVEITSYQIKAIIIHTYSSFFPDSPEWMYSNNTNQTELITLLPGTKYNISLSTKSSSGEGGLVYKVIETKIADPDNIPAQPEIISREGTKVKIKLMPTTNNNGPVTSYRIIVVDEDAKQGFDKTRVLSYDEAKNNGESYYIAAELNPKDIDKEFVVGDGRKYGKYYNAPLDPNINYNILLAVVSEQNGITKIAYSDASGAHNGVLILNVNQDDLVEDSPAVIIGLSVAIGLLSFMLIAGIIAFIILKSRVINRRQRLSDNQELTLQGPMIEVENNGYIHEDEHIPPVNYYRALKQKIHTISSNQLKIEPTNLLGVGKYGRVNSGTVHENNTLVPVAVYSIQDKKMSQEIRKSMLHDLDVLIKVGKHDNLIGLVGTCETSQVVSIILDYVSMNLKDLLLGSRDNLPGTFSNMSEAQALDIAIQIAKGMAHLESCKIIHKQLCARSVMISNGFTPKIGSYGIAQYFSHNKIPDYTRWTALEVFKSHPHNLKSDVWSFSCLLWEICVLGGTPYGNVSNNNEIPERIVKGLRLPQLQYISDDLYQIMLDCWQLDCDERPDFPSLVDSLTDLKENNLIPYLSFNLFSNFQYEQFYPDMELAVRPVF